MTADLPEVFGSKITGNKYKVYLSYQLSKSKKIKNSSTLQ